jgi:peptide deformylase
MFTVLTNKQTPKLKAMTLDKTLSFINDNKDYLLSFLNHTIGLKNAAGLASNQCGIEERFCACYTSEGWKLLVNPIITSKTGDAIEKEEGCLSWPNKYIIAKRNQHIEVEYCTLNGDYVTENYSGWSAQVIQHEVDHLNGVKEKIVERDYKTIKREEPKLGRNDPCHCGSGKKYKKCHG